MFSNAWDSAPNQEWAGLKCQYCWIWETLLYAKLPYIFPFKMEKKTLIKIPKGLQNLETSYALWPQLGMNIEFASVLLIYHESESFLRTVAAFWSPGFLGCVLAKQPVQARSSQRYGVGVGYAHSGSASLLLPRDLFCHLLYEAFLDFLPVKWELCLSFDSHKGCTFSWNFLWICLLASCLSSDCRLFRAQFLAFLSWSLGTPEYSSLHNGNETDI